MTPYYLTLLALAAEVADLVATADAINQAWDENQAGLSRGERDALYGETESELTGISARAANVYAICVAAEAPDEAAPIVSAQIESAAAGLKDSAENMLDGLRISRGGGSETERRTAIEALHLSAEQFAVAAKDALAGVPPLGQYELGLLAKRPVVLSLVAEADDINSGWDSRSISLKTTKQRMAALVEQVGVFHNSVLALVPRDEGSTTHELVMQASMRLTDAADKMWFGLTSPDAIEDVPGTIRREGLADLHRAAGAFMVAVALTLGVTDPAWWLVPEAPPPPSVPTPKPVDVYYTLSIGWEQEMQPGSGGDMGSGCSPGPGDLPDGVWVGWIIDFRESELVFDVGCAGPLIGDGAAQPSNSSSRLRSVEVRPQTLVYRIGMDGFPGEPFIYDSWPVASGWCEPHAAFPDGLDGCYWWLAVNHGAVTEMLELWHS